MKQLNMGFKLSFFSTIALVILVLFLLLLVYQWRIFQNANTGLIEENAALESLRLEEETIDKLNQNKNLLRNNLNTLQNMIPSDRHHAAMLSYLHSIFTGHNIEVIELQFNDYVAQEGYEELPINISIKGEYGEVIALLKELRVGSKPFRIDELFMNGQDESGSILFCDVLACSFFKERID